MAEQRHLALIGQPNSGKSSLFNALTGAHQHVGNWPGKTVERKSGSFIFHDISYEITDLPGAYSLSANSDEEMVNSLVLLKRWAIWPAYPMPLTAV